MHTAIDTYILLNAHCSIWNCLIPPWASHGNIKDYVLENIKMMSATNKQSDHLENYLATTDKDFFNFCPLLIMTITYHAPKTWHIYKYALPEF